MAIGGDDTEHAAFIVENGHPGDVRADKIARANDDRTQQILQGQRARQILGRIDQEIQPPLVKRVVFQHLADRTDLQAEFVEARGVALASRSLLHGLDKAVDFGIRHAERDLFQKVRGGGQKIRRHPFSSRKASSKPRPSRD